MVSSELLQSQADPGGSETENLAWLDLGSLSLGTRDQDQTLSSLSCLLSDPGCPWGMVGSKQRNHPSMPRKHVAIVQRVPPQMFLQAPPMPGGYPWAVLEHCADPVAPSNHLF